MKQDLVAFFRKITAAVMSVLVSVGIISTNEVVTPEIDRGEENTVSSYDTSKADYTLSIDALDEVHEISDMLYGIFFEDINFAADGGLYAEKIVNRSFEYGTLAAGDELHGWSQVGAANLSVKVNDIENGLNENNTNYLVITNESNTKAGVQNKGFLEGMSVEKNANYYFSAYIKGLENYSGKVTVRLVADGKIAATGEIACVTGEWEKYELKLVSTVTANENVFCQVLIENGKAAFDMVSLFPDTYKNHGMRIDLAEKLAELEPKFLRFPGGCVIEGWDEVTAYDWKASIGVGRDGLPLEFRGKYGDVATRTYGTNIWTALDVTEDTQPCYMSYGLGFFEYFQLAEDIGAVGVPVLNCGLYCQMRGKGPVEMGTPEFEQYVQDMVDLVEFCRGDETSTWGKVRASLGHPEPFELKYIGIGNENEGEDYFERYEAFLERFLEEKEKNPEMYEGLELIYSSGAADATHSSNYIKSYENAYDYVNNANDTLTINEYAGATDQHYYNNPSWFLENVDYYDEKNYPRDFQSMTTTPYGGAIGVFLGEYAARSNRLEASLAEAAYMTGLERNGDIVKMAAYAPLFGNLTATHWAPNLIWFNNHLSTGSISYYMQKLFSINAGTALLNSQLDGAEIEPEQLKGKVGLGTWYTKAEFDDLKVVDNVTGEVLAEDNFSIPNFWWNWKKASPGKWKISGGKISQTETELSYNTLGATAYYGDDEWSNYTYTFTAKKLGGAEGFYIPFLVEDEDNFFCWNIGGWDNTRSALQRTKNGETNGEIPGTVTDFVVETGKTYDIKIEVNGYTVKGYIDGELQFEYVAESECEAESYHVVSTDETGDIIIKLVNVTSSDRAFAIDLKNMPSISDTAKVYQVAGNSLNNDNILGAEEDCKMEEFTLDGIKNQFNFTVPQYSATVIRISK